MGSRRTFVRKSAGPNPTPISFTVPPPRTAATACAASWTGTVAPTIPLAGSTLGPPPAALAGLLGHVQVDHPHPAAALHRVLPDGRALAEAHLGGGQQRGPFLGGGHAHAGG